MRLINGDRWEQETDEKESRTFEGSSIDAEASSLEQSLALNAGAQVVGLLDSSEIWQRFSSHETCSDDSIRKLDDFSRF